jgi:hypothetical protein
VDPLSLPGDPYDRSRRLVFTVTMLLLASVVAYGIARLVGALS